MTLDDLSALVRDFARAREWEQFHTSKNLAMALGGEVGELLAIFQWLTPEEAAGAMSDTLKAQAVRRELADILSYLLRLADVLGVDLAEALQEKVALNEQRYPVAEARGHAKKYSELGGCH